MIFSRVKEKDLDSWIGKSVKVVLNSSDGYYEGVLIAEQKNGILLEGTNKKMIYIQYDSIVSLEEL
jgi:ribosome maturation factor RimP